MSSIKFTFEEIRAQKQGAAERIGEHTKQGRQLPLVATAQRVHPPIDGNGKRGARAHAGR